MDHQLIIRFEVVFPVLAVEVCQGSAVIPAEVRLQISIIQLN
jgi:hypothetical protein